MGLTWITFVKTTLSMAIKAWPLKRGHDVIHVCFTREALMEEHTWPYLWNSHTRDTRFTRVDIDGRTYVAIALKSTYAPY